MARKISFINYKGGVGKTSLIVNTAAALAKLGKRVLLFDFDTQSNASIWLLRLERWNKINATGDGAIYSIFDPGKAQVKDMIIKDVVEGKTGEKLLPGLDLVPTTFNLVDLEAEFTGDPKRPPYVVFNEQLRAIEGNYDFILFDCPPNILRASQCGVFSSNEIYVPSNPDALSLIGFTLLVEKLQKFHQLSASFRNAAMGVPAQVQGIVFNSIKAGVDIEVPKMRMQLRMNQFRTAKRVGQTAKIFDTQIRDAMVVRRAVALGLPVMLVGADAAEGGATGDNVINDYKKLANEIVQHGPAGAGDLPNLMKATAKDWDEVRTAFASSIMVDTSISSLAQNLDAPDWPIKGKDETPAKYIDHSFDEVVELLQLKGQKPERLEQLIAILKETLAFDSPFGDMVEQTASASARENQLLKNMAKLGIPENFPIALAGLEPGTLEFCKLERLTTLGEFAVFAQNMSQNVIVGGDFKKLLNALSHIDETALASVLPFRKGAKGLHLIEALAHAARAPDAKARTELALTWFRDELVALENEVNAGGSLDRQFVVLGDAALEKKAADLLRPHLRVTAKAPEEKKKSGVFGWLFKK